MKICLFVQLDIEKQKSLETVGTVATVKLGGSVFKLVCK